MKYKTFKKFIAILLAAVVINEAFLPYTDHGRSYAETGTINTDRLNMRTGPGTNYSSLQMLSMNMKVEILDSVTGTDGKTWYRISAGQKEGYVRSDYIKQSVIYSADDTDFESYMTAQGFPDSYKNSLRGLHAQHPNWVFVGMQTGLDWNEVLKEESRVGLNLVDTNSDSSWKSTEAGGFDWANNYWPGYDGASWVAASPALIAHYLDPRNFLTDPYVFQFEIQTYDPASQTRSGLEQMVKGTFLEGSAVPKGTSGNGGTYTGPASAGTYGSGSATTSGPAAVDPTGGKGNDKNTVIDPVVSAPPGANVSSLTNTFFHLIGGIDALAGWEQNGGNWYYRDDDGRLRGNGWHWIDGNKDGVAECYYFDENGVMAKSCRIGDYEVNADGAWIVNGQVQTRNANASAASGTSSYIDLIMKAAQTSGVSPYVLAAMIIQEQGKSGNSPLISGSYGSYAGYYNFYNINAYAHNGMTAVESGLKYASESGNGNRPWNTIEKAVVGGALAYGENYTNNGQDTFYLKKFNVQGSNKYKHQFMSNIIAAAQEGAKVANAYTAEIKEGVRTFKIPIYLNMPESPCDLPYGKGNPNNHLASLSIDGFALTPTFDHNTTEYSLVVNDAPSITVNAQPIDGKASVSGTGTYTLGVGLTQIDISVKAENGDIRTYRINVTRKQGSEPIIEMKKESTGESTVIIGAPPGQ